jgi:hypothetical protein
MTWIVLALLFTDEYRLTNVVLLNSVLGPADWRTEWHFWFIEWFIEALVYILLALVAVLAVPALDRLERRIPFGFPATLMTLGLITRYDLPGLRDQFHVPSAIIVFWLRRRADPADLGAQRAESGRAEPPGGAARSTSISPTGRSSPASTTTRDRWPWSSRSLSASGTPG